MTLELIERLAREAGFDVDEGPKLLADDLAHFAALVAEHCAKVCDPWANHQEILRIVLADRAAAIRAKFPMPE